MRGAAGRSRLRRAPGRRAPEPHRRGRPAAAFTLLEVLVALVLFVLSVTALSSIRLDSLRSSAQSTALTRGKALAAAEIERLSGEVLRVTEVAGVTTYAFATFMTACTLDLASALCRGTNGTVSWQVAPESPGSYMGEGLLRLTATADLGSGRSFSLMQMVSCYDVYPSPSRDTPAPCPTVALPAEED